MPQIRVLLGYQQGQVFCLDETAVSIGRDPKSGIVLHPDSAASRRHAELFPANGQWRVRDLGSVNGTVLNGRPIQSEVLRDKDEILIGDNVFVFEEKDRDAAQIAAAASHMNLVDSRSFQNRPEIQALVHGMAARVKTVERAVSKVLAGGTEFVREILAAIITQGHVILAGIPAAAQAAVLRTIAELVGLKFAQIDSASAIDPMTDKAFSGSQILLVNRLDKLSPGMQAALFQGMDHLRLERDGQSRTIELPFIVIAAQPSSGVDETHPLSDSQRDRFIFFVEWTAIPNGPRVVIDLTASPARTAEKVFTAKQLLDLQRVIREVAVSDHVMKYAVRVVRATRPTDKRAPETIKKHVHAGAGPRAVQNLIQAAKARAVLDGRLLVEIADVRNMALPALGHRLCASFSAGAEGWSSRAILEKLLAEVDARDDFES